MSNQPQIAQHAPPKAVIFGCSGTELTQEERSLFSAVQPFGFILFQRNCESPRQVAVLIKELQALTGRHILPIFIDQEGGRVARLKPPHWRECPPAGVFAKIAQYDLAAAKEAVYLNARLMAEELFITGINVNCAPVLDIRFEGCHDIVGDRAFGDDAEQVSILAAEMARGLMDGGILPVIKHIPGHGRALADSHESLPIVEASLEELRATDFAPFIAHKDAPFAMTAHILYKAIDGEHCATLSSKAIDMIRNEIGFEGLLLSDDISMKALEGNVGELSRQALNAGCDIVLHCNGKIEEMRDIALVAPSMSDESIERAKKAWALRRSPAVESTRPMKEKLDAVLAAA